MTGAEKKTVKKSIRLSEESFQYINHYPGNSFTDKLESLIRDYAAMGVPGMENRREELLMLRQERDRLVRDIETLVEFKTSLGRLQKQFADMNPGTACPMA